jgi:hypothetical protein
MTTRLAEYAASYVVIATLRSDGSGMIRLDCVGQPTTWREMVFLGAALED